MFNRKSYLFAKLNNFYIDKCEEEIIDQTTQDELIEELESMETKQLYDLCVGYELSIPHDMFKDIFGNFLA